MNKLPVWFVFSKVYLPQKAVLVNWKLMKKLKQTSQARIRRKKAPRRTYDDDDAC